MPDLAAYREQMIEAILARHLKRVRLMYPQSTDMLQGEQEAFVKTYSVYAAQDVDAIIAALRGAIVPENAK